MSRPGRAGAVVWRAAARLVPTGRRDWVEAAWAEAHEVPPGLRRLAWRAGGARLMAREAGMARRIGGLLLFAAAATAAAWAAWPDSTATGADPGGRAEVITLLVLAGLPLLARPVLGPPASSRIARLLRAGTCAGLLALLPALAAVGQFRYARPPGSADLAMYVLISPVRPKSAVGSVLGLIMLALYMAAITWMTSRRSRIAPATLGAGLAAGIALGLVMYTVAPLGLSSEATDPWLPGPDVDPLVLLAWLLLVIAPAAAAVAAVRHCTATSSLPPPASAKARQAMAAGLLASMAGALSATTLGTGTTAAMINAAWLRNWLYHGPHLLYGVQNLSSLLRTPQAIAYSHQLTGAVDAGVFSFILLIFPAIALVPTGCAAMSLAGDAAAGQGGPQQGGSPSGPAPAPPPGTPASLPSPHDPDPRTRQDPPADSQDRSVELASLN